MIPKLSSLLFRGSLKEISKIRRNSLRLKYIGVEMVYVLANEVTVSAIF